MSNRFALCVCGNAAIITALAAYLFIAPAGILLHDLCDPALRNGDVPRFALRWHRALSPKYATWARERVAPGNAASLDLHDISGTEWPVFSAVFYLWATEALQEAWEEDPTLAPTMPREYARGAIQAAAALVADPHHAAWVKKHWGDDYLQRENLFYRMLLISGLSSYQKLLDDDAYQELLRAQVESLSQELDDSPFGLLDDYPGQCYPIDILPAIAAIRRADAVLGSDHSDLVARALRAFEGERLDARTGLPAYIADSKTGQGIGSARGVGISFMLTWALELWPQTAAQWYARYEEHFWQEGWLVAGVRELPRGRPSAAWFVDVDAGPVLAGYGTAASAFGIGATRAHGRFDHVYPLSAQALVASWPLPDGTLLGARMLSNLSDAPYVGETALLFTLTRRPLAGSVTPTSGGLPFVVYVGLSLYACVGGAGIAWAIVRVRRWRRRVSELHLPAPRLQLSLWLALVLAGGVAALCFNAAIGVLLLLLAQPLPRT